MIIVCVWRKGDATRKKKDAHHIRRKCSAMSFRGVGILALAKQLRGLHGGVRVDSKCARTFSTTSSRRKILSHSPNAFLNKAVLERYRQLKYDSNKIQATYLWIDGTGENVRLKDRILDKVPQRVDDVPQWQYDGSSTYQALGENSDTTLVPRALYRDPFKVGENDVIVVCDTYKPDGSPSDSNHRHLLQDAVDKTINEEPWFGIEQEYTLLDMDGRPFGWPTNGYPAPQGPYCKYTCRTQFIFHLIHLEVSPPINQFA